RTRSSNASCASSRTRPTSRTGSRRSDPRAGPRVGDRLPRLALLPGESAGVGPELCVRLAQLDCPDASLVAIADGDALLRAARRLGLPLELHDDESGAQRAGRLALRHRPQALEERPGRLQRENVASLIAAMREAA